MKKYTNIIDPKTGRSKVDPQTGKTLSVLVDMTAEEIAAFEAERAAYAAQPPVKSVEEEIAALKARIDALEAGR